MRPFLIVAALLVTPAAGFAGHSAKGVPAPLIKTLRAMAGRGQSVDSVALSPTGGYIILFKDGNELIYEGIPNDLEAKLRELNGSGRRIQQVAFTPEGGWVVLYQIGPVRDNKGWGYSAKGIPEAAAKALSGLVAEHSGETHPPVCAFGPKGSWVVAASAWHGVAGEGLPGEMQARLRTLAAQRRAVRWVSLSEDGGWAILSAQTRGLLTDTWCNRAGVPESFDAEVDRLVRNNIAPAAIAFGPRMGWVITFP